MNIHIKTPDIRVDEKEILRLAAEAAKEDKVFEPHTVEVWRDEDGGVSYQVIGRSPIDRIRRITGYLSKDTNFNDAKLAELRNRKKHMEF